MRILVSDPELLVDLRDFLRRARCIVFQGGHDALEVVVADAPNERQAVREVRTYLAAWRSLHPEAEAILREPGP